MNFKLRDYILPSVISMLIVGTNANVDGIFIGKMLGDDGLAAINIVWPIFALTVAVGTGVGVGGSVILNELRGEKANNEAEIVKNTTIILTLMLGVAITLILLLCCPMLLKALGADGNVLRLAENYAFVIACGSLCQVFASSILVILRNDGKTYESMILSVLGLVLHIVLDILLAKRFKMYGVAAATVVSQLVVAFFGFCLAKIKKEVGMDYAKSFEILRAATAPFGLNFVPSFVLLFTNYFALKCGGVNAVSAYALMCYVVYTFDYIFQGVCDGVQPIISYCSGAKDDRQERKALKWSAGIVLTLSIIFALITPFIIKGMLSFFEVSGETKSMFKIGLIMLTLSYPFKSAVKFCCSYFYAVNNAIMSNILVFCDPVLLTPLLLAVLSHISGINGVWFAMPVSQIIITLIGIFMLKKTIKYKN